MWKTIETAPKDGTPVLLCVAECYMPTSGCWATYHPNATGKACWRTQPVCGDKLTPTHWQELPPAPGAAREHEHHPLETVLNDGDTQLCLCGATRTADYGSHGRRFDGWNPWREPATGK